MTFNKVLRNVRIEKGLTQKALSEQIKVSRITIAHWESGYSEPSIIQLIQIANFFNITIDELVGRDNGTFY